MIHILCFYCLAKQEISLGTIEKCSCTSDKQTSEFKTHRLLHYEYASLGYRKLASCILCQEPHDVTHCVTFLGLSTSKKMRILDDRNICSKCLTLGHPLSSCVEQDPCPIDKFHGIHHLTLCPKSQDDVLKDVEAHIIAADIINKVLWKVFAPKVVEAPTATEEKDEEKDSLPELIEGHGSVYLLADGYGCLIKSGEMKIPIFFSYRDVFTLDMFGNIEKLPPTPDTQPFVHKQRVYFYATLINARGPIKHCATSVFDRSVLRFLKDKKNLLQKEMLQNDRKVDSLTRQKFEQESGNLKNPKRHPKSRLCYYCGENHMLETCLKFLQQPLPVRAQFVNNKQLCAWCLGRGHSNDKCHKIGTECGYDNCAGIHPRVIHSNTAERCAFCSAHHFTRNCAKFRSLSVNLRIAFVKKNTDVCQCCLIRGHQAEFCSNSKWKCGSPGCSEKHNHLLHPQGLADKLEKPSQENEEVGYKGLVCSFCAKDHQLYNCTDFFGQSPEFRKDFYVSRELCKWCLGFARNHSEKNCTKHFTICGFENCGSRHPRVMHRDSTEPCTFCERKHPLRVCLEFQALPSIQRSEFVAKNPDICLHCLQEGHGSPSCTFLNTVLCGINGCQDTHNKLIHLTNSGTDSVFPPDNNETEFVNKEIPKTKNSQKFVCLYCKKNHQLYDCSEFILQPFLYRKQAILEMNLCKWCLLPSHKRKCSQFGGICGFDNCNGQHPRICHVAASIPCAYCTLSHPTRMCQKFIALTDIERCQVVYKDPDICRHCLDKGHQLADCKSRPDRKCSVEGCQQDHNPLIHPPKGKGKSLLPTPGIPVTSPMGILPTPDVTVTSQFGGKNDPQQLQNKEMDMTKNRVCQHCKGNHILYLCPEFMKLPLKRRQNFILQGKICKWCFGENHIRSKCPKQSTICNIDGCGSNHTPMLHFECKLSCSFCNRSHLTVDCLKFLALTPLQRWEFVSKNPDICQRCLTRGHQSDKCKIRLPKTSICKVLSCNGSHHMLIHPSDGLDPTLVCPYCDGSHSVEKCEQFLKLDISKRRNITEIRTLCYVCLESTHKTDTCPKAATAKCGVNGCNLKHHPVIHQDASATPPTCFVCRKQNHHVTDCVTLQMLSSGEKVGLFKTIRKQKCFCKRCLKHGHKDYECNMKWNLSCICGFCQKMFHPLFCSLRKPNDPLPEYEEPMDVTTDKEEETRENEEVMDSTLGREEEEPMEESEDTAPPANECPLCKSDHILTDCSLLTNQTVSELKATLKKQHCCLKCFKKGHNAELCTEVKEKCPLEDCSQEHHYIIHQGPESIVRFVSTNTICFETLAKGGTCPKFCFICDGQHLVKECKTLTKMDTKVKAQCVAKLKLCPKCLEKGHTSDQCSSSVQCTVDNCNETHLAHMHDVIELMKTNPDPEGFFTQDELEDLILKEVEVGALDEEGFIEFIDD